MNNLNSHINKFLIPDQFLYMKIEVYEKKNVKDLANSFIVESNTINPKATINIKGK